MSTLDNYSNWARPSSFLVSYTLVVGIQNTIESITLCAGSVKCTLSKGKEQAPTLKEIFETFPCKKLLGH